MFILSVNNQNQATLTVGLNCWGSSRVFAPTSRSDFRPNPCPRLNVCLSVCLSVVAPPAMPKSSRTVMKRQIPKAGGKKSKSKNPLIKQEENSDPSEDRHAMIAPAISLS